MNNDEPEGAVWTVGEMVKILSFLDPKSEFVFEAMSKGRRRIICVHIGNQGGKLVLILGTGPTTSLANVQL
jgi:hypothetical protein